MNILDENVPESQRRSLASKRIRVRQIGFDLGRRGMKDEEIIPFLHELDRPTFFTRDADFHDRRLCHSAYCLVYLDIDDDSIAEYVQRVLRHAELNTKAKRMGCVVQAHAGGMSLWRKHEHNETCLDW